MQRLFVLRLGNCRVAQREFKIERRRSRVRYDANTSTASGRVGSQAEKWAVLHDAHEVVELPPQRFRGHDEAEDTI